MYLLLVRKKEQAVKVTQVHVCVGSPPTAQLEHHVELFYLLLVFEWINACEIPGELQMH